MGSSDRFWIVTSPVTALGYGIWVTSGAAANAPLLTNPAQTKSAPLIEERSLFS